MESQDWQEETAGTGWIEVKGLEKGEAETPVREEEVTPPIDGRDARGGHSRECSASEFLPGQPPVKS
jgi:hypothetical protein